MASRIILGLLGPIVHHGDSLLHKLFINAHVYQRHQSVIANVQEGIEQNSNRRCKNCRNKFLRSNIKSIVNTQRHAKSQQLLNKINNLDKTWYPTVCDCLRNMQKLHSLIHNDKPLYICLIFCMEGAWKRRNTLSWADWEIKLDFPHMSGMRLSLKAAAKDIIDGVCDKMPSFCIVFALEVFLFSPFHL